MLLQNRWRSCGLQQDLTGRVFTPCDSKISRIDSMQDQPCGLHFVSDLLRWHFCQLGLELVDHWPDLGSPGPKLSFKNELLQMLLAMWQRVGFPTFFQVIRVLLGPASTPTALRLVIHPTMSIQFEERPARKQYSAQFSIGPPVHPTSRCSTSRYVQRVRPAD